MLMPGFSGRASKRSGPFGFCHRKQALCPVRRAHSEAVDSLKGNVGAVEKKNQMLTAE